MPDPIIIRRVPRFGCSTVAAFPAPQQRQGRPRDGGAGPSRGI